ncbi:MAG TPA: FixH family protein [Chloroflexi bacterium]|nr:FixH family protein [Chloroflexota bacterium]
MTHRSLLHRLLATMLLVFFLAACGASGGSDAAPARNAPATIRFAEQQADGIHGWLAASAAPATGTANVDAYLEGADGQPIANATVTFDVDMTNMSHGKTLVTTRTMGDGHYAGDVHFMMPGPWRIIAMVERPGQAPVQLHFEFQVQTP